MMRWVAMGVWSRGRSVIGCLAEDRGLLISALALVSAIRLGLWVFPVRTVAFIVGRLVPREPGRSEDPFRADRVARAVARASRVVPGARCLTQALAAQVLLERSGLPTRLHIGVVGDPGQTVRGHAWVESQGVIVIGAGVSGQWSPLLVVEGARTWSLPRQWPS
jgi:hypothetical protein